MLRGLWLAVSAAVLFALTWPLPMNAYAWAACYGTLLFIVACANELRLVGLESEQ